MRILCLLSAQPGHLDFGGFGYIKLAQQLLSNGHTLHWLSPKNNVKKLQSSGFKVKISDDVDNLFLIPILSTERIQSQRDKFKIKLQSIKSLLRTIDKYDLIICDRILALGTILAEKANKPIIVVGSPATHFNITSSGVIESAQPITNLQEVGEIFGRQLKCSGTSLTSFWAKSPLLNICFVNNRFYQFANPRKSAYVNHFSSETTYSGSSAIGFSFGNTGSRKKLIYVLDNFIKDAPKNQTLHAFAGDNEKLQKLLHDRYNKSLKVHGWVNFREEFANLGAVVCFGGIGTIWEAINCNIPIVTIPDIGDQQLNSHSIERLGLGRKINLNAPGNLYEYINHTISNTSYNNAIAQYKHEDNYTDSLETLALKISKL